MDRDVYSAESALDSRRSFVWIYLASFCIVLAFYQLAFQHNLSPDSYSILFEPSARLAGHHSSEGRPLAALVQLLIGGVGLNIVEVQKWTFLASVCLLALATTLLERRVLALRKADRWWLVIISLICSCLVVCNVFITEWFGFSFITPVACLSQLLAILAALRLSGSSFSWRDGLSVMVFAIASAASFQASISMVAPLALVLLCADHASARVLIRRTGFGILAYCSGGICSVLYARLVHPFFSQLVEPRIARPHLWNSAVQVWRAQSSLWISSMNLRPRYLFAAMVLACLLALLWRLPAMKLSIRWAMGLVLPLTLLLSFGPHLVSPIVWIVPRSITTVDSIPGLLLLGLLLLVPERGVSGVAALAVACLTINIVYSNQVLSDFLSTYREDQQEGRVLYDRVLAHERATKIPITKLAFAEERFPVWCYPEIRCFGDLNVRSWTRPWARVGILQTVSGRRFTEVPLEPHTTVELFAVDEWGTFDPDKIRFIGDTAYIGIY